MSTGTHGFQRENPATVSSHARSYEAKNYIYSPVQTRRGAALSLLDLLHGECARDAGGAMRACTEPFKKFFKLLFSCGSTAQPQCHRRLCRGSDGFHLLQWKPYVQENCRKWSILQYPLFLGLILAMVWCSLVCLSRVYMGMHSILDVVAGVLYAVLILIVFHPALDIIDNFNLTYKYAPLIIISLHVALGIFSFTLDTWSTSRGDTAEILGSGAGIACGSHVRYMLGLLKEPSPDTLPFTIPPFTVTLVGKAMLRVLIGLVVLLLIRAVMKMITIPMACKIFGIPCDDIRKARQRMEVELPYRYLTYVSVGFAVMFLVPYLFTWVGLH
ncbi:hypothetical protein GDO78_010477 [Eleutherodactylus coqui]|uniref:Phosphatidic acid phosphatase type 2/haloperoxidase domain-containing protein n=1 Tax=Eleutherodactylus coqui TaxID=57060 RepID=A0A8J6K563_ELECQ|nr:hypothetical protein GDO78_010477 [Eleutherodactylus coqui]